MHETHFLIFSLKRSLNIAQGVNNQVNNQVKKKRV